MSLDKTNFLARYRISDENFDKTGLAWSELESIYENFISKSKQFHAAGKMIAEDLHTAPRVHSIKYRVKEADHLIEKIIRKKLENQERSITLENYQTEITDLLGLRVLHLFKDDWFAIHEYIVNYYDLYEEKPTVYIRSGDFDLENKPEIFKNCEVKIHKHGYRSIHYLIKTKPYKEEIITELQVRTIFEEGWSEIDHSIRYPYDVDNPILNPYIQIFNRLAGNADEMGTYIKLLKNHLDSLHQKYNDDLDEKNNLISDLETQISQLQKLDKAEKDKLLQEVKTLKQKVNIPYDWEKGGVAFDALKGTITLSPTAQWNVSPGAFISAPGPLTSTGTFISAPGSLTSPGAFISAPGSLTSKGAFISAPGALNLNNGVKLEDNYLVIPAEQALPPSSGDVLKPKNK